MTKAFGRKGGGGYCRSQQLVGKCQEGPDPRSQLSDRDRAAVYAHNRVARLKTALARLEGTLAKFRTGGNPLLRTHLRKTLEGWTVFIAAGADDVRAGLLAYVAALAR